MEDENEHVNSIVLKELIEDFVENFNKHRNIVDELCLTPFYSYISGKLRGHAAAAYTIIAALLIANIVTLLIVCDVRSTIRNTRPRVVK